MSVDFSIIWANNGLSTKSNHVNAPYHFVHVGEIINYIEKQIKQDVDLLDVEAEEIQFQDVMKKIIKNKYKAIAFYTNTENLQNTIKLLKIIRQVSPHTKTIVYGDMPLYLPKFFKNTDFDAIVSKQGDQEIAILDFFNYAIKKRDKDFLRGVIFIENGNLVESKKGEYLDPQEWGYTDIKKVPIQKYFQMSSKEQVVVTVARGCPYNCKYCNAVLYYGKKERRRPINSLIEYINNSPYYLYKFFAPNFTLDEKYVFDFSEALIKNEKKIKWSCTTRPDLLKNEQLIKKMAESGCYKIAIGIESVEQKDLNSIEKQYDRDGITEGIKLLKKYGIEYKALIMFGVPNQTKDGIKYTLDFLNSQKVTIRPTAYTPFYEMNHNMSAEQISKYDKRTYYEGIKNLSYGDFLKLIYNTQEYKEILS